MSKVFINESTLTNIGAAIREKTGKSDLIAPGDMPAEIRGIVSGGGGGGEDIEPIVLTGACNYSCSGDISSKFIELYPDKIITNDLTNASYMFYQTKLSSIPFELNFNKSINSGGINISNMFAYATELTYIPNFTLNPTTYGGSANIFNSCTKLANPPYIYNLYPDNLSNIFSYCYNLRELPEDYFDTWNFDRIITYASSSLSNTFLGCYSLRKFPSKLFEIYREAVTKGSTYVPYNSMCRRCYSLDEVVGLPIIKGYFSSNIFSYTFESCSRLKRLVFETNEDGTVNNATWKSQNINLTVNVGYCEKYSDSMIYGYNSGITMDKEVKDDATYHALKNDKDWYTRDINYSRYNRTSAVETINSLPDTTEYLASVGGGTNTIKFTGAAGALTDGGAINTMTEEEIAVATAKGWSVSFV